MSDTGYDVFQHYGTDAERLAFTPDPSTATDVQPIYIWYATDTGLTWLYDTTWHSIAGPGGSIPTTAQGDLLYASGVNTLAALAKNATATRYLSNTGASNNPAWAQVDLTNGVTGDLPFSNLAQGAALSVLGVTGNATADVASIAAASDHQVLRRSGTAVAFGQVNLAQSAAITGVLPIANGGSGSASGYGLLKATGTLTDAQVKALPTTPFALIAAPAVGFYIDWHWIVLITKFAAGAYTNLNATYCIIAASVNGGAPSINIVNDSTTTPALTTLTRFVGAATRRVRLCPYVETVGPTGEMYVISSTADGTVGIDAMATLDNKALQLYADNNGSGDFTGGNAANTLVYEVGYTVEATP